MTNNGYATGYGVSQLLPSNFGYTQFSPIQFAQPNQKELRKAVWTEAYWMNPPFGRPRELSFPELEPYTSNIWVNISVNHITDSVVATGWDIVPVDEEKGAADSHIDEVSEFFESRTWNESFKDTLRRMVPDLLLWDAGTIIKVFPKVAYDKDGELKNPKAKPVELMARDGRAFLKDTDLYGLLTRWWMYSWINPTGKPISFAKDEICYFSMRPQSKSPYGISSLEIIKNVVDYLSAAVTSQRRAYENGMFLSAQIDHPDIVDPDELLKRAQMYKEQLKGEDNYGKVLVTSGGVKIIPLNMSPKDMEWLQGSQFMQKLVFSIFKLNANELGFTDSSVNRATAEVQSEIYKSKGVRVVLDLIEDIINREIVWKHFSTDVKFSFDKSLDLQDEKIRTDIDHVKLSDGIITVNEIRNREGKNPFEDEEFDKPFAVQAYQQKLMEGGMGEEGELEGEHQYEYGEEETPEEGAVSDTEIGKFEKAVTAEIPMGKPGSAMIPTVYDQKKQKKKEKKLEDDAVNDLTRWGKEQQEKIEEELKRVYKL